MIVVVTGVNNVCRPDCPGSVHPIGETPDVPHLGHGSGRLNH